MRQTDVDTRTPYDPRLEMRGVRAGFVVLAGIAVGSVTTAAYHLLAARWLGPRGYAELAALLALLGLVSFPLAGAQFTVARAAAHARATNDDHSIRRIHRRYLAWTAVLGALATLVLVGSAPWTAELLDVRAAAVVITGLALVPAFAFPVVVGLIQGLQRFLLFAAAQAAVPLARTMLLPVAIAADAGVAGALGANAAAFFAALLVFTWLVRVWLRAPGQSPSAEVKGRRTLVTAVVGILAFTSLTTLDVVVAKLALTDSDAGLYGAASVLGRLILFVPAAVAAVLLPRVTSRSAVGRETRSLLLASMGVTAGVALATTLAYAVAPRLILRVAYGTDFVDAAPLLWKFGLAMTLFGAVNLLLVYDIGRSRSRTSILMAATATLQVVGFVAFHESATQLVLVDVAIGATLMLAALVSVWFGRSDRAQPAPAVS